VHALELGDSRLEPLRVQPCRRHRHQR
jgi:hypothetical protein